LDSSARSVSQLQALVQLVYEEWWSIAGDKLLADLPQSEAMSKSMSADVQRGTRWKY